MQTSRFFIEHKMCFQEPHKCHCSLKLRSLSTSSKVMFKSVRVGRIVFSTTKVLIVKPVNVEYPDVPGHLTNPKFTLPMLTELLLTLQSVVTGFDKRADCTYARQIVPQCSLVLNIKEFRTTPLGTDTRGGPVVNCCKGGVLETSGSGVDTANSSCKSYGTVEGVSVGKGIAKLLVGEDLDGNFTGYT